MHPAGTGVAVHPHDDGVRHRGTRTGHGGRHGGRPLGAGDRTGRIGPGDRRAHRARPAHLRAVRGRRPGRARLPRQRRHLHPRPVRRPRRPGPAHRRRAARRDRHRRGHARAARRPARVHGRVADRRPRRPARGTGVLHRGRHPRLLCRRLEGPLQLGPHRGAARRTEAALGPHRRRRGGTAPVEHPRHALLGRRGRLHRGHAGAPRPGRPLPRRLRLPGDRGQHGTLEARPAPPRRHGAVRATGRRRFAAPRDRRRRGARAGRRRDVPPQRRRQPAGRVRAHAAGPRAAHAGPRADGGGGGGQASTGWPT